VISCPFEFQLPEDLPPSFHSSLHSRNGTGSISYSLEVVGERPGLFRSNRRIRRVISVVPAATRSQLLVKESLIQGWTGEWKDITQDAKLRQGIWGDHSYARAILSIPDLPSFPIATSVPFSLHVLTETKLVQRSDTPEDKYKKPLFPAPPTRSSDLTQILCRQAEVRVPACRSRHIEETFDLQGIRSLGDIDRVTEAVTEEPEWIPKEDKDRGIWRRTVHFNSSLMFSFAPTFSTDTLDWAYVLHFIVHFPGMGNDLKIRMPIDLGAGSACPPPPIGAAGSSSISYADIPPDGPPPMLDLPPYAAQFLFNEIPANK
ncbi:hypothetical protein DFH07DRAFT_762811, partial [Mycena maculata]